MIGELVCPDCGGVVGATERTEAGDPCRCFADRVASRPANLASDDPSVSGSLAGVSVSGVDPAGDGVAYDPVADAPVADAPPKPAAAKLCRDCGKDLAGHRRYKDAATNTYQCPACRDEELKRLNFGRVPCRVCGQLTKEEKLTDYEGTKMCPDCHDQRTLARRQEIQRIGFHGARVRHELHGIYVLLAIAAVLAVIVTVGILIKG